MNLPERPDDVLETVPRVAARQDFELPITLRISRAVALSVTDEVFASYLIEEMRDINDQIAEAAVAWRNEVRGNA